MKQTLGRRPKRGKLRLVVALVVVVGLGYVLWGGLRLGPLPVITMQTDHPAVGAATKVEARFTAPAGGLGHVTLEVVQGDRAEVVAERTFQRGSAFNPLPGAGTASATLEATVGVKTQPWLKEGPATLRATADRFSGPFRSPAPFVFIRAVTVRTRPPRLEILSSQNYATEGGAGVVVMRVGDTAVRSGVRAGTVESVSFPMPGRGSGERFTLYAVPWDLGDGNQVRAFAEDDAGNRVEVPFLSGFKVVPPRQDTIHLDDAFLERVVPAIASRTPGFDASGSLLDQYLAINGAMRAKILQQIKGVVADTQAKFLWSGPFLQLPNSAMRAGFAQTRTYMYEGKAVDHQTHLGLDLASTSDAPVPAANGGRVLFAGWLGIYGNAVIIDHGYGLASLYGHLSSIDVKVGDAVTKGQIIAHTGATGLAGGDHLHLEIFVQGQSVSPLEWLDGHWIRNNVTSKLGLPSE